MKGEPNVKAALQLGPLDRVEEVGVFRVPASSDEQAFRSGAAERMSVRELVATDRERRSSTEPRIQASLPRGRARRLDDVPGVLVFEGIPAPKLVLGPVERGSRGEWVADVRREPAVLLMDSDGRELELWGERGRVRVLVVDRLA